MHMERPFCWAISWLLRMIIPVERPIHGRITGAFNACGEASCWGKLLVLTSIISGCGSLLQAQYPWGKGLLSVILLF